MSNLRPLANELADALRGRWRSLRAWLSADAGVRTALALILVVGALLRLTHLNWDQGTHIHPDERFLTMVESALQLPKSLSEFFDSTKSPMNPYNRDFGLFVYGTLPIFIVRIVAEFAQNLNQALHIWNVTGSSALLTMNGYDAVHLVGRALSGLFDLAVVPLLFLIGGRLYGRRVGLVAAALYAFAVLPLQQSHFFTVDTFATFFAVLTFYFAVRVAQGGTQIADGKNQTFRDGGWLTYVALGASLGASLASRINLAPMAGIALLAAGIRAWDDWRNGRRGAETQTGNGTRDFAWLSVLLQATLFRLLLMLLVAFVVFRVGQPYAFGGRTLLDLSLSAKWQGNMQFISQLIAGDADQPPAHQWAQRTPFIFPWVNMVVWGMGLPMGLAAWAGWALALWQIVRGLTLTSRHPVTQSSPAWRNHLLPVIWIGGMFLYHSSQFSYSMRYYLPIYPFLAMMGAWVLWRLVEKAEGWRRKAGGWRLEVGGRRLGNGSWRLDIGGWTLEVGGRRFDVSRLTFDVSRLTSAVSRFTSAVSRLTRQALAIFRPHAATAAYALLALVVIGTMLWGWGFLAIYRRPLTRITASRWIYKNIPAGATVANEHWDDALPFSIDGKISFRPSGAYQGLKSSSDGQMQMYGEDTPEKREQLYRWLNETDYIFLSSNRLWGSIPRLPMRYPMSSLYYRLLFAEKLGFRQVAHFTSFPTIFGVQFNDTTAEEAFSVYDHPEVYIFQKTPEYSDALVRSYLDAVDLEQVITMWPKQVNAAPTALMFSQAEATLQQAGGAWSSLFNEDNLLNRSPVVSAFIWLLLLEALGLAAFPIAFVVLRSLTDRGYGVSKTLGVLLLAWLSWIGPSLKLWPYQRWTIALALGALLGFAGRLAWRRRAEFARYVREHRGLLLTEEAVFLLLFGLFLLIRIGNPDLWHPARGGEKPMDFAYLMAVIKSTTFPPYDPWHAGGFLSYYYYGFVIVGTLIKLTGVVPWVAYNLVIPTLFALTGVGAFSVAFNLAAGDRATVFPGEEAPAGGLRIGSTLAGLAGVFFVTIIGNFGNVKLLIDQLAARSKLPPQAGFLGLQKLVRALDGVVAVAGRGQPFQFPNDWWFWNASRVIPDTINEFPFFTFTYADLHAHMIALPLTLLGLAVATALIKISDFGLRTSDSEAGIRRPQSAICNEPSPWRVAWPEFLPIALLGLVAGALRATNTWDFPTYLLVGLIAMSVLEAARRSQMAQPEALDERLAFLLRAGVSVLWRMVILVAVAVVTFYPFTKYYATAYAGLQLWTDAKSKLSDYLTVHGFFLTLAVIYLISEAVSQIRERQIPDWVLYLAPAAAAVVIVLIGVGWVLGVSVWLIALPLAATALMLALGREVPQSRRLGLLLIALALAITMGVEVVRQRDDIGRMNTVFKFYMQAWVLFGVGAAFGLAGWASRAMTWHRNWRRIAWGVTAVLFIGVMLYPAFAARAKIRDRFSAEASPRGLDGIAYMDKAIYVDNNRDMKLAADKDAISWLLHNVQGSPVILEGVTPNYRWGSRFSIYTGLPAVAGWDWHQKQQRSVVPLVVDRRIRHVGEIYNTTDTARARHLLNTYGVSYIIVGELERAYYQPQGLAKFDAWAQQGYLRQVYPAPGSNAGALVVRIYEVTGRGQTVTAAPPRPTRVGPPPVPTPTPGAKPAAPAARGQDSPLPTAQTFASPKK